MALLNTTLYYNKNRTSSYYSVASSLLSPNYSSQTCAITFEHMNIFNWVLLILGGFGNLLSIVVMNKTRMRSNTASITITTLAIADTLTLLFKCLQSHLKYVEAVHYSCFAIEYFLHVSVMTSIWIIVWMTIERALAVWCPLQINTWITKLFLFIIISCTIVTFSLMNIHFLFAYEPKISKPSTCLLKEQFKRSAYVLRYYWWIKSFFYSWLPILILISANIMIVFAIRRASISRSKLMFRLGNKKPKTSYFRSTETQMTTMLLCVSIVFIIVTLPFSINQLYLRIAHQSTTKMDCLGKNFNRIIIALADLNHGINFILYCITGRKFRKELRDIKTFCDFEYKKIQMRREDSHCSSKYSAMANTTTFKLSTITRKRNNNNNNNDNSNSITQINNVHQIEIDDLIKSDIDRWQSTQSSVM